MSIIKELISTNDGLGWLNGKFASRSLFLGDMDITIYSDTENAVRYAEKCIAHYNSLTDNASLMADIRDKLRKFMYYMRDEWEAMGIYEDIAEDTDKAVNDIENGGDILDHLKRPCLNIDPPKDGTDEIGYEIVSDCPWEPEHQCSIIIRGDKLKYAGPCEGNTPWDDDDDYYCIWLDDETE